MEKQLTAKQQAANAIKWLDNLRYYKKTTAQLGRYDYVDNTTKYCCLGVACKVMKLKFDLFQSYDERLKNLLGFSEDKALFKSGGKEINGSWVGGIMSTNDQSFKFDRGFKNMTRVIKENFDDLFVPEVAEILKKHYNK